MNMSQPPDPPEKRLLYIALIGFAAILPLAMNRHYGAIFSLAAVACVIAFIRSDRKRGQAQQGFPVVLKDASDNTLDHR
jgi:hypothetical protein